MIIDKPSPYAVPGFSSRASHITANRIVQIVAQHYNVPIENLFKKTRQRDNYLIPRQVAIYLIRTQVKMTLNSIGSYFQGDRPKPIDHTTIVHTMKAIRDLIEARDYVADDIEAIKNKLNQ